MDTNNTLRPGDALLTNALDLPKGDVLIRKIGGPDGIHPTLGYVKRGRVYCVSIEEAEKIANPLTVWFEFELVFKSDRTRIEAASKQAQNQTQGKTKTTSKAG